MSENEEESLRDEVFSYLSFKISQTIVPKPVD